MTSFDDIVHQRTFEERVIEEFSKNSNFIIIIIAFYFFFFFFFFFKKNFFLFLNIYE